MITSPSFFTPHEVKKKKLNPITAIVNFFIKPFVNLQPMPNNTCRRMAASNPRKARM